MATDWKIKSQSDSETVWAALDAHGRENGAYRYEFRGDRPDEFVQLESAPSYIPSDPPIIPGVRLPRWPVYALYASATAALVATATLAVVLVR